MGGCTRVNLDIVAPVNFFSFLFASSTVPMPPMSNVVVKIPVTRRPINYSRFPHPVYMYIYIYMDPG